MSFAHIKGQDTALNLLKGFIGQGRVASSYLFCGPESVGKKLAAINLAKTMNCEGATALARLEACGTCASCKKIDKLEHPDFHLFLEDPVKIEDIRQLKKDIGLRPYEGKFKVFIIDNAHTLTAEAQNALLKVLEEPPAMSLIILITSKPALLFKTIISRCRIIKFSSLPRQYLKSILENEHGLDKNYAHFLSYFSEGRPGIALKLKDTDLFRDKNRIIDDFCIRKSFAAGNLPDMEREELKASLNILAVWYRDVYLVKAGFKESEIINFDRESDLDKFASELKFSDLDRIFKCISDSLRYIDQNLNMKLLLSNLNLSLRG